MTSSPGSSRNTGSPELTERTVVLLGDPVGHSLSAVFQNAGFRALQLPARYEARRVRPAELASVIAALRADEAVLGANVTIPHKLAVAPLLDGLGPEAQSLRAVNTISRRDATLVGWNTDRIGFVRALEDAGYDARGRSALVLGAGGAARAVVDVLRGPAARCWVVSRNLDQARALLRDLPVLGGGPAPLGSLGMLLRKVDLVVNTTPVGLDGHSLLFPEEWITPEQFVFDVLYHPPVTPLVSAARRRGARASNGLTMLLYQGLASFEIWTGQPAPEALMRAALEQAVLEAQGR